MKRTPTSPAMAHHRLMKSLVKTGHSKDKIEPRPEEFEQVARVFTLAGGSWERVFLGGADDMNLLKTVIRVAVKTDVFTKAARW